MRGHPVTTLLHTPHKNAPYTCATRPPSVAFHTCTYIIRARGDALVIR